MDGEDGSGEDGSGGAGAPRPRRRVHLPLAPDDAVREPAPAPDDAVREPAIAEGARSLASWGALHRDLAADPALADRLVRNPDAVLARYGIRGTSGEIQAFVEAITRVRRER